MSHVEILGEKTKISVRALPNRIINHSPRAIRIDTLELEIEKVDGGAVDVSLALPGLDAGSRRIARWQSMETAQRSYDSLVDKLQLGKYEIHVYGPNIYTFKMLGE